MQTFYFTGTHLNFAISKESPLPSSLATDFPKSNLDSCLFVPEENLIFFESLGQDQVTYLNNTRITPGTRYEIKIGDRITIGKALYTRVGKKLSLKNILTFYDSYTPLVFCFHIMALSHIFIFYPHKESSPLSSTSTITLALFFYIFSYSMVLGYSYVSSFLVKTSVRGWLLLFPLIAVMLFITYLAEKIAIS